MQRTGGWSIKTSTTNNSTATEKELNRGNSNLKPKRRPRRCVSCQGLRARYSLCAEERAPQPTTASGEPTTDPFATYDVHRSDHAAVCTCDWRQHGTDQWGWAERRTRRSHDQDYSLLNRSTRTRIDDHTHTRTRGLRESRVLRRVAVRSLSNHHVASLFRFCTPVKVYLFVFRSGLSL